MSVVPTTTPEGTAFVDAPVLTVRTRLFYARKELYAALAEEPALAALMERFLSELPGRPTEGEP
jgi:RNA polymerase sigma-70 factor (ECF subfamily)